MTRRWMWRSGDSYNEQGLSAYQVLMHESKELGNTITILVPLEHLKNIAHSECLWCCRTRKDARRYGNAYKVYLSENACILASDTENPKGYYVKI